MAISVQCPMCGKTYAAPAELAGMQAQCRHCGAIVQVPAVLTPLRPVSPRRTRPQLASLSGLFWSKGRPTLLAWLAAGILLTVAGAGLLMVFQHPRQPRQAEAPSPPSRAAGEAEASAGGLRPVQVRGKWSVYASYDGPRDRQQLAREALEGLSWVVADTVTYDKTRQTVHFSDTAIQPSHHEMGEALRAAGFNVQSAERKHLKVPETIYVQQREEQPAAAPQVAATPAKPAATPASPRAKAAQPGAVAVAPALPGQTASSAPQADVRPGGWSVVPDPVPAPKPGVDRPIPVGRIQVTTMFFSRPDVGQAVMAASEGVAHFDLAAGKLLAQLPPAESPLARPEVLDCSPDGKSFLLRSAKNPRLLEVWQWEAGTARSLYAWPALSPTSALFHARFIDPEHVLVVDRESAKLTLWNAPKGQRRYEVPFERHTAFHQSFFSLGRKYVVCQHHFEELQFYETATGRPAGKLGPLDTTLSWIFGAAFRPDGKVLAAAVRDDYSTWARSLACWDMATGDLLARIPMAPSPLGHTDRIVWFSPRYAGVVACPGGGHLSLVDLTYQSHVWDYDLKRGLLRREGMADDPGGRLWVESLDWKQGNLLIPVSLPRPAEAKAIDEAFAGKPAVLKPGDTVSLDLRIRAEPPFPDYAETAAATLTERLQAGGIRVAPDQPVQFRLTITQEESSDVAIISVYYKTLTPTYTIHELRLPRRKVTAELAVVDTQGQTPWRLVQAYGMNSISPSEELPNHVLQAKPRFAAQAYPWVKVQRWLREVALPREFYPRQPEPLGESRIP